jgi:hypothetical protein
MSQKTQIVFEDGKFQELTTTITEDRRTLALPAELIKAQQKSHNTVIKNVFKVSTFPSTLIVHSTGSCCYMIPLLGIPWKQYYIKKEEKGEVFPDKYRRPYFLTNGHQTPIHKDEVEKIDVVSTTLFGTNSPFRAFMALTFTSNGNIGSNYLFLSYNGELYVPPLPNIFSDGRICMGQTFDNYKSGGFVDHASIATWTLSSFSASIWGSHLLTQFSSEFCAIDKENVFAHTQYPEKTVKRLMKNAPAFLGKWTPSL